MSRTTPLEKARAAAGFETAAAFAKKYGFPESTYRSHENGNRPLTVNAAKMYAAKLGISWEGLMPELFAADAAPAFSRRSVGMNTDSEHSVINRTETMPNTAEGYTPVEQWPRDLPVMGLAECGQDGWSLWNGEIIQMAPRPPSLAGVRKAYAVYVVGDSMENRYYAGEIVWIHPARPPEIGDFVLVQLAPAEDGEAPKALLKRLVKRTHSKITLEQFNPKKQIEVKTSEMQSMHLVVGSGKP